MWVFDPDAASIEVYSPIDGRPTLIASARAPAVLPPFEARIDPGALLRRPG